MPARRGCVTMGVTADGAIGFWRTRWARCRPSSHGCPFLIPGVRKKEALVFEFAFALRLRLP